MKTLEQVLRDAHDEANVLARAGANMSTRRFEEWLREFENSTIEFREFLSETDAVFRSGKSVAWFRSRFDEWQMRQLARYNPNGARRERQYRLLIVPMRANLAATRDDAREAAREIDSVHHARD